ncbi:TY-Chap2 family putative peptide chaperone [Specibacter sp. AOP5-B1-6]|uniref:TY-Chap2 family putative peptide chaperone n=1 Tax=Specibacter sp. AOP5-B1-6 TaxID=3457653 RepID=UPI00402BC20F
MKLAPVPYRYVNALSWRLASDLCRRHNELFITFPGGGSDAHADALMVSTDRDVWFQMRRRGGGVATHGEKLEIIEWADVFAAENPREIVRRMEESYGITPSKSSAPTTPRTMGYRVISAALDATLNDTRRWRVDASSSPVSLQDETNGIDPVGPISLGWVPGHTRWHLHCDDDMLAVFDSFGHVKTDRGITNLLAAYKSLNRRVGAVLNDALGHRLP